MKHITQEQLDRLDLLYRNGQLDGRRVGDWTVLSEAEGRRLIAEAELASEHTCRPATETLKHALRNLIRAGKLVLEEDLLRFMSLQAAEELCWMFQSSDKNTEPDITRSQFRRIKVLMAKGFLKYRPSGEIKNLSFKAARKLIEEGESNALEEKREA